MPRQDGVSNGSIGQYEFYVSQDGASWGTPVATGTFANTTSEKQVLFSSKTGQYVRLRALSEVNGNPWTAVAELNVLQAPGSNQAPTATIDTPSTDVTIFAGATVNFTGTGSDPDGNLPLSYRWSFGAGSGIADSTLEDPGVIQFNNLGTYVVTFTVGDSLGSSTQATRTIAVQSPNLVPHTGWTVWSFDSQETMGESAAATNAIDGNNATIWATNGIPPTLPRRIDSDQPWCNVQP